jgi:sugar lactone lactonase YvrE
MNTSDLIPSDAILEQVYTGVTFAEGPAADAEGNVYLSDCPNNRILCYRPADGTTVIWKDPSQRANGMNFDSEGRLLTCCAGAPDLPNGARSLLRYEHDGSVTNLASHYDGKRLNAPNDLCFDRQGRIYFTDPQYGDRSEDEQDCMAVYRLELDGSVTRVIDDMQYPNGILISADNKTLYIVDHNPNEGGARTLVSYSIADDGTCQYQSLLHDFGTDYGGDGMVLDIHGNIYLTAGKDDTAGIYIFSPTGDQLGFIQTPEIAGNCTFGGEDLKTLYIAASSSLYRIRLNHPGLLTYPKLVE